MSTARTLPSTSCGGPAQAATTTSPWLPDTHSPKIRPPHWERLAVVYIRQSTPQQVLEHRESARLQYGLVTRAVELGWPAERVLVIDEDQGLSGRSAEGRPGFQRLLVEVNLDHVGLILGLEMSRLARSNKDWHHLLEVCAIFHTLLGDQDGLYDPNDPNDRLLLGLKGTMGEMEFLTMRARLERGSLSKAQRGELFLHAPTGYVLSPTGTVELDPDEQVRAVVQLIFDKFDELGTATGVFRYLARNGIRIGVRPTGGANRGQVEWRLPCRTTVVNLLHNPIYAGAYAYGRRGRNARRLDGGRPRSRHPSRDRSTWLVLLRDRVPAYISWDRYEANIRRLEQNRAHWEVLGAPREGPALLGGLIRCPNCRDRLRISYHDGSKAYYLCTRNVWDPTARSCPAVPVPEVDRLVSAQVLRALEPASLELSLQAIDAVQRERARLDQHWRQRLERARYEAERAARQYHAVEPENRLVARTLEQRWEQALRQQRQLEEEYDRFLQETPPRLTAAERERIAALAADIPALWDAPTTTAADRQALVRHLVERVEATVQHCSEMIDVTICWAGGFASQHQIRRSVLRFEQLRDFDRLCDRIVELQQTGQTAAQIAAQLNADGFHTPRKTGRFTVDIVRMFVSKRGLGVLRNHRETDRTQLRRDEWTLPDLARKLRLPLAALQRWCKRGWLHCRRLPGAPNRWIAWADKEELVRLRRLRACPLDRSHRSGARYPKELTTPKQRPDT